MCLIRYTLLSLFVFLIIIIIIIITITIIIIIIVVVVVVVVVPVLMAKPSTQTGISCRQPVKRTTNITSHLK